MCDLQTLLANAVQRIRNATFAEFVVAWALREDGSPYVAAAAFAGGDCPENPDSDSFALIAQLPGATDLSQREIDPDIYDLARSHQCHAAAPVRSSSGAVLAVLLLRAPGVDPPRGARPTRRVGSVVPRILAELDAAAHSLAIPLAAALAAGRLLALDEHIRHLDRLAALGQLTAEIAHEVRNPLVSIKTFLQLIPERRDDPEFFGQFCSVVGGELDRMERLLDTLVAHGRRAPTGAPQSEEGLTAAEPPSAHLGTVVESVSLLLQHSARLSDVVLEIVIPPGLPPLCIEPDRLQQVALNLALNAIGVSPPGETVRLEGRPLDGEVELAVTDFGPGISENLRDWVFEPFFSTRSDHAGGLGLFISRRIVEEAGGQLDFRAFGERGTEFSARLPV